MSIKPTVVKIPGNFIKIDEYRILKSSVKRYQPSKNGYINIYFNSSINHPDFKSFHYTTIKLQQEVLNYLDSIYL